MIKMKTCTQCAKEKPLEEFYKHTARKDGRQSYCKECAKKHFKTWKDLTPERQARQSEWKKNRVAENRQLLVDYFKTHPCVDCFEDNIVVLEFDHVRGEKKNNVGTLMARGSSWEKILEEIAKCEVRCANCHRKVTAERGGFWTMAL